MQHWIFRIFECPSNFFTPLFRSIAQISRLLINNRNVSIKLLSPRDGQLFMLGHRQPCFFRANWPKASERVEQSTMIHAYLAAFDLSSFSLSLRLFRRIVAFVSVSPLPSCSPVSFFLRSTSSYLHSRLFHSRSLLFPYFFHRHPFLAPSSSSSLLPTLIDLLNQQLRNFQHQKSWRTRKMNDRPRCSNDPSLK